MKRSAKFLSVLLIMALCVSFVPAAYALGDSVIGGPEAFEETAPTPASKTSQTIETKTTEADPAADPSGDPTVVVDGTDESAPSEISVATAEQLLDALATVAYKGTVRLTENISGLTSLVISRSVILDLGEKTLSFSPAGDLNCAIYVAEDVDFVNIVNGQISLSSVTDEEGNETGYAHAIVSNAGWMGLNWADIRGKLVGGGSMLVNENEDGDLVVMCGDFAGDPSAFVGEDYTVEKTEEGWQVREAEKAPETPDPDAEAAPSPEPAPSEEPEPDPTPSEEPEPTTSPEVTPETAPGIPVTPGIVEEQDGDGYVDDMLPVGGGYGLGVIAQIVDSEDGLKAWAAKGSDTPVILAGEIELTNVLSIDKSLSLNLNGAKLTGAGILVTNDVEFTVSNGEVSGDIQNNGKMNMSGVKAGNVSNFSGGVLNVQPDSAVAELTVEGGEVKADAAQVEQLTVLDGSASLKGSAVATAASIAEGSLLVADEARVEDLTIKGGSVSLDGFAHASSISMSGGELLVLDAPDVTVGEVIVSGDVSISINSGSFDKLDFAPIKKVSSESGVYQIAGEKVTGGTFKQIGEAFIAEGYSKNAENGIAPISISGNVGVTAGEESEKKDYAIYFKGTKAQLKDVDEPAFNLDIKVTDGDSGLLTGITAKHLDSASKKDLERNTDYEYEKGKGDKGGTVELLKEGDNLADLKCGFYNLEFEFAKNTEEPIVAKIFVFPYLTYTDTKYILGTGDTVTLDLGDESDVPDEITFAKKASHKNTDDTLLTSGDDYTVVGTKLTVNDKALKAVAKSAGTYYLGLWYGNDAIYVKITVREAPSVSPSSQSWTYNGGDVTLTVYSSANKATAVRGGDPAIKKANYSISKDGRTVTIKADYLKHLVDTETGEGHGKTTFTIVTEDGNVETVINIRPALWARDGENTHRKGSKADLVFDCSAPIDPDFAPTLGTKPIKAEDSDGYDIDGNTITLTAEFLNERASQDWTLGVTTIDGDVVYANFKVTGTSSGGTGVATGDENNAVVWAVVLVLSGAAVVALIPKKKKQ